VAAQAGPGPLATVGVIGGSGFYEFLDDATEVVVETPYGSPSEALTIGTVAGRPVAFLPRHGKDHRFPPHRIPYQANLWALRSVGVRQVLAPSAVGSLSAGHGPGTLVIPDQVVDRTSGRPQTFYADGGAVHVQFADPYCPAGRSVAVDAGRADGWPLVPEGTLVVIEGPRFSTRAESRWYAAQGWTIVGMTGHPEAVLARELALCYTPLCLVTDTDAGVDEGEGVTHDEVMTVFAENLTRMRALLKSVIRDLPEGQAGCPCATALDGLKLPITLPGRPSHPQVT
jgi:5'-methylthioadenosine phosphorylase